MITAEKIKNLRISRGLSQLKVAEELGISRTSYLSVEKGKRDLSFEEADKISCVLGVTLEELLDGVMPDFAKYCQMLLQFLRFQTGDRRIPKTKLAKLLYLADFAWFYGNLESMSGMRYRKNHFGPVPDQYFRAIHELEEKGLIEIDHKAKGEKDIYLLKLTRAGSMQKLEKLSKEEMVLMKEIREKWKKASSSEIVAFTHAQLPYSLSFEGDIIPYELITQEEPDHVF